MTFPEMGENKALAFSTFSPLRYDAAALELIRVALPAKNVIFL
jgi:hypothetical protein